MKKVIKSLERGREEKPELQQPDLTNGKAFADEEEGSRKTHGGKKNR